MATAVIDRSYRSALRENPPLSADAHHAIDRVTFGQTPELLRELATIGSGEFLRRQLWPSSIDDSACDNELRAFERLYRPARELVASNAQWEVQNELVGMMIVRAVRSKRQLLEHMVDFWTNHLSVNAGKHRVAYMLPTDNQTFRARALGRYDDLLIASAKSLSMLTFLDNRTSRADINRPPNENYARELLEIHTLGTPDAFTEADVKAVAHVFTGWTLEPVSSSFQFRGSWNRLGPAGGRDTLGWTPPYGSGRIENGESLLRHLARHPSTARTIGHKLCRHFIRDGLAVDDPIVQQVAASYLANDTDIRSTLATLFASEQFRNSAGARIKRPNELLYSMLRASSARFDLSDVQRFSRGIKEELVRLDQVTFAANSPKGYPLDEAAWMDASSLINRWNLAFRVAANRVDYTDIDTSTVGEGAANAGEFVDEIGALLLGKPLQGAERAHLLAHLGASAESGLDRRMKLKRAALVGLTLASPTFQAR